MPSCNVFRNSSCCRRRTTGSGVACICFMRSCRLFINGPPGALADAMRASPGGEYSFGTSGTTVPVPSACACAVASEAEKTSADKNAAGDVATDREECMVEAVTRTLLASERRRPQPVVVAILQCADGAGAARSVALPLGREFLPLCNSQLLHATLTPGARLESHP